MKKFQNITLRTRLLVAFALLSILPVFIIGSVATLISSQGLQDTAFDELRSIATLKENEIHDWLQVLQTNLGLVFENQTIERGVSALLQNDKSSLVDQNQLRDELTGFNNKTGYFVELFVLDHNGNIVLSTDGSQEGKIQKNQSFFLKGLTGQFVSPPVYEVSLKNYSITISEPIKADDDTVIGVLAARVNISTLSNIMQQQTGLGETGETYLVSSNFAALTTLKNTDFELGKTYIRTEGVSNAIKNKTAGASSYTDYAGNPTFGVYQWVPELQVALVAEHQQSAALAASNRVLQVSIALILVTSLIALSIAFLLTTAITRPITNLVTIANSVAQGNFALRADVSRQDEIGVLAQAFNRMTAQLADFISSLEQRVADRTKALAASNEVSRRISNILDQKELVTEVVNEVNKAFGYYHTQIYFFDANNENLVMAGGTGEAGRLMLEQFHKVRKGNGLVGRAAASNEAVLVPDTLQNSEWLSNPLLPDTKSEMAIPIAIGDQVLGVLDIQHNIANGLQQEDVDSLRSIANQVAIASQNIRQYENTRKIAADMGVVATVGIATSTITETTRLLQEVVDLSKKSFGLYHAHIYLMNEAGDTLELAAGAGEVGRQMVAEKRTIALDNDQSLVARAARTREGVVVNDVTTSPAFLPNPLLPNTRAEMAVPMIVAGKVIGVLDVQSEQTGRFTSVDVNIKTTLASQVAIALQNARTLAQSRQHAARETAVNTITQKIQTATSVETALQIAARELGHALGRRQTFVSLEPSALGGHGKEE